MIHSRRLRSFLAALLGGGLLVLAGCSSETEVSILTCPQVYMVQDAARYTDLAPGSGSDLLDVRYDARMTNVEWLCSFFTDENRVEMEVRFGMRAMMGPAADGPETRFPYFVVVADPDGKIIAKQVFAIDIVFPGNSLEIGHVESAIQKLTYTSLARASEYTVYIGFQLSPEQLARVRAEKAK